MASAKSASKKSSELRQRIGELEPILKEGFKLLEELKDAEEAPFETGLFSKKRQTIRNKYNTNDKRATAGGKLVACLRGIPTQIGTVNTEWQLARAAVKDTASRDIKKDTIKRLGEFAFQYLRLWAVLAGLDKADDCAEFPRIKKFAEKAMRYYKALESGENAIKYFIGKRNKILLDEEVDDVIRYVDALMSIEVLQSMPSPPASRGGGRKRRATRKRRSTRRH